MQECLNSAPERPEPVPGSYQAAAPCSGVRVCNSCASRRSSCKIPAGEIISWVVDGVSLAEAAAARRQR